MNNEAIREQSLEVVADFAREKGFDHELMARLLREKHADAQNGMRRVIAFGIFCFELKELHIKHGQFGPWLEQHAPEFARPDSATGISKPSATLSNYMALTASVLEAVKINVRGFLQIPIGDGNIRPADILVLPDDKIPQEMRQFREKVFALVDGKSQRQLMLEFRNPKGTPQQHHPAKPLTAEEALRRKVEEANAPLTDCWRSMYNILTYDLMSKPHVTAAARAEVKNWHKQFGRYLKKLKVHRRDAEAQRGGE